MPRNRVLDQSLLLLAGIAVAIGGYFLWYFVLHYGISKRVGFFIIANLFVGLAVTWQGAVSFRRVPGFWLFHLRWTILHILVYGAWGYSGNRIELCAFTLIFEAYWYYRIAESRFSKRSERTG